MTPDIEEGPTYLGCTLTGEVMKAHWEDSWGEVPGEMFSRWMWRQEVASGNTQLGYWEWVQVEYDDYVREHQYPY